MGLSLATFVACQYWSSVMFNVKIVGVANATGAGWGNMGGGFAQLIMPWIFDGFSKKLCPFLAWRATLILPGILHIVSGFVILVFCQDLPDGTFYKLRMRGTMAKIHSWKNAKSGLKNWRMWLSALLYGYSFGIELTVQNIVVPYFFDTFDVSFQAAGIFASVFGLLNLFARSIGGFVSDKLSNQYGMRGRLFGYWILQSLLGGCCILVGLAVHSLLLTVLAMGVFSVFVQASEGACYGIIPFISKRALGVVTGFVGAGGNFGSTVVQSLFFRDER